MNRNRTLWIVLALLLSHTEAFADFTVKMVLPFNEIVQEEAVATGSKASYLGQMNQARNLPLFKGKPDAEPAVSLGSLLDDLQFFSLDITDNSGGKGQYLITTNIPSSWKTEIRRQALLADWYSSDPGVANITYWGDAMPQLKREGNSWPLPVKKGETVRLNISFKVMGDLNGPIRITIQDKASGEKKEKVVPLTVYNKKMPSVSFSSIVFNGDNTISFPQLINTCTRYGFTHMQVNYVPEFRYDAEGNITGPLLQGSSQTIGFMQTAVPWVQQGLPVLFFWNQGFATKNGNIPAYTDAWRRAYVNAVKQAVNILKQQYPSFSNDQVVLYVYDELGSGTFSAEPAPSVNAAKSFLAYLRKNLPQFKRLVTFSYSSFPADINAIKPETDILVPHFVMPTKLEARYAPATYNPALSFRQQFSAKTTGKMYWTYMVESGKSVDVRDYRLLPLIAALNGYSGLSWYAFCNSNGSSWVGRDGATLDYSLYYRGEPGQPLYDYWTSGLDKSEATVPSIRAMAAGAGIQDAKILSYLLRNAGRLPAKPAATLGKIKSMLQSANTPDLNQPEVSRYLSLEQIETISRQLREIYAQL